MVAHGTDRHANDTPVLVLAPAATTLRTTTHQTKNGPVRRGGLGAGACSDILRYSLRHQALSVSQTEQQVTDVDSFAGSKTGPLRELPACNSPEAVADRSQAFGYSMCGQMWSAQGLPSVPPL